MLPSIKYKNGYVTYDPVEDKLEITDNASYSTRSLTVEWDIIERARKMAKVEYSRICLPVICGFFNFMAGLYNPWLPYKNDSFSGTGLMLANDINHANQLYKNTRE